MPRGFRGQTSTAEQCRRGRRRGDRESRGGTKRPWKRGLDSSEGDEVVVIENGLDEERAGVRRVLVLKFGECFKAGSPLIRSGLAGEQGNENVVDKLRIGKRFAAGRDGIGALAGDFAIGEGERLLGDDALLATIALEHGAVVKGSEEAMLEVGCLREVERAAQGGFLLHRIDARATLAEVEQAG